MSTATDKPKLEQFDVIVGARAALKRFAGRFVPWQEAVQLAASGADGLRNTTLNDLRITEEQWKKGERGIPQDSRLRVPDGHFVLRSIYSVRQGHIAGLYIQTW